ncbi:MAG TPA: hypothetical protein VNK94_07505 [Gaiellaceae bacterium]|nr:hypothetical protein [Gaiellaceae bacterium]
MGGAAPLLSGPRRLALAVWAAALAGYGSAAEHLFALGRTWDVAFVALLVLPAGTGLIWLALPLAAASGRRLAALIVLAGALAAGLDRIDLDGPFTVAKLISFALVGFALLRAFETLWWLGLVAVLVPLADVWSVAAGPTRQVLEQQPGLLERIAVASPFPGENAAIYLGPPDVMFFALFLAATVRFRLRPAPTWLAMTALLGVTLALVVFADVSGLPALPAVCLGFLLPNADLLWGDARREWRKRRRSGGPPPAG